MTRINLGEPVPKDRDLKVSVVFPLFFSFYWGLFLVLHDLSAYPIRLETLLKSGFSILERAHTLAESLQHKELALNFLANINSLNPNQEDAFQSSGLMHLLAISGGQILPLLLGMEVLLSFFILKSRFPSQLIHKHSMNKRVNLLSSFVVAMLMTVAMGFTGSLLRVSCFYFCFRLLSERCFCQLYCRFPAIPSLFYKKVFSVLLIFLFIGNPFTNWSFLLSVLGGSVAFLCFHLCRQLPKVSFFMAGLFSSALTTFVMGVMLAPLFSFQGGMGAISANLLALPLVTFVITPLSLVILAVPDAIVLLGGVFDFSLGLLEGIAMQFGKEEAKTPRFFPVNREYLGILIIFAWAGIDVIAVKGERFTTPSPRG